MMIRLTSKDPNHRPLASEVYSKVEDELYQEYLISDQTEYHKIVSCLFKNRFQFQSETLDQITPNEGLPVLDGKSCSDRDFQRNVKARNQLIAFHNKIQKRIYFMMHKYFIKQRDSPQVIEIQKEFCVWVQSYHNKAPHLRLEVKRIQVFDILSPFQRYFAQE